MRTSLLMIALVACDRSPPWDVAVVRSRLVAAGWTVVPAANPGIGARGIVGVDCVDATRGGATDTFCVVRCASSASCSAFASGTWESYGTFQRGATLLVHQVCGHSASAKASFDCVPASAALGL